MDTHSHIEQKEFDLDREKIISQAKQQGIWIITSAITPLTWSEAIKIGKNYDNVETSIGMDPTEWTWLQETKDFIQKNQNDIIAIGEIGLDHYIIRNHSDRDRQEAAFRELIDLANNLRFPIQIHSRSAGRRALEVLSEMNISIK